MKRGFTVRCNRWVLRVSRRMRALQAGSIQAYLIYIFITLLLLLLYVVYKFKT